SMCTGGAVSAILITNGMNPLASLAFSLMAGMAAGAVTGLLHTKLKIPAILSGILTQLALYSINLRIMGKPNLSLLNKPGLLSLGNIWGAILVAGIFVIIVMVALYWFFGTEIGSAVRATGNNAHMVRALGVNTDSMKVLALVLSNGLVALAGGLMAQFKGNADINMSRGAIVIGLASVIIGEVIFGSRFNFAYKLGSIVAGSVIYYIIIAVVLQLGLGTSDLKLFSAIVVALALALPVLQAKVRTNANTKKNNLAFCKATNIFARNGRNYL
ncbi:MAG: ABC transporter permease, partial [Oscillospiraceae bacterium]